MAIPITFFREPQDRSGEAIRSANDVSRLQLEFKGRGISPDILRAVLKTELPLGMWKGTLLSSTKATLGSEATLALFCQCILGLGDKVRVGISIDFKELGQDPSLVKVGQALVGAILRRIPAEKEFLKKLKTSYEKLILDLTRALADISLGTKNEGLEIDAGDVSLDSWENLAYYVGLLKTLPLCAKATLSVSDVTIPVNRLAARFDFARLADGSETLAAIKVYVDQLEGVSEQEAQKEILERLISAAQKVVADCQGRIIRLDILSVGLQIQ